VPKMVTIRVLKVFDIIRGAATSLQLKTDKGYDISLKCFGVYKIMINTDYSFGISFAIEQKSINLHIHMAHIALKIMIEMGAVNYNVNYHHFCLRR